MIEMIKPSAHGFIVYESFKVYPIKSDLLFMKDLHHRYLLNYDGRKEAIKTVLKIQRNLPLFINQDYSWMIFKDPITQSRWWVNVFQVLSVETLKERVRVTFKSGHVEEMNDPFTLVKKRFDKALKMTDKIIEYLDLL
jgi:hypothetical protein